MPIAQDLFQLLEGTNEKGKPQLYQRCKHPDCGRKLKWRKGNGYGSLRQHYQAYHQKALHQWDAAHSSDC